ncbi:MAG: hypothetical protein K2X70_04260 [Candidatus Obscuribacterales bacterium]|nr:hypothetical protein [Candidatus Obscuribacterales bacterium]
MLNLSKLSCLLIKFAVMAVLMAQSAPSVSAAQQLVAKQSWTLTDFECMQSIKLVALVQRSEEYGWGRLQICKDEDTVFTFDPGAMYLESLFLLDNNKLASRWSSGIGSDNRLVVFGWDKGSVRTLLDLHTKGLIQEFVYPMQGEILLTGNIGQKAFSQRIINPYVAWRDGREIGKNKVVPLFADIYIWDENNGNYKVKKHIPWRQRFRGL